MTLLLCGLVGFFVSQLAKTLWAQRALRPWVKTGLALVGSAAAAATLYPHHVENLVIYGIAGGGLALVIHKVYRLISTTGDHFVQEIMLKRGRR